MKKLIKLEWKKLKYPVLLSALLTTLVTVLLTMILYKNYAIDVKLEAWELGTNLIISIFPLLIVLPTCWLMYYEKKDNFLMYTITRADKKEYLFSKWIVISLSSFMIIFISMFIGVLIAIYINPEIDHIKTHFDSVTGEYVPMAARHVFGKIFVDKPLLYGFLLSLWRGLLSIIITTMGFVFSLYIDNIFIVLTGPFIYYVLENFILSILNLENYRFVTAFSPDLVSYNSINIFSFLAAPLFAIVFIIGIVLYFKNVKKTKVFPS